VSGRPNASRIHDEPTLADEIATWQWHTRDGKPNAIGAHSGADAIDPSLAAEWRPRETRTEPVAKIGLADGS
jgi:hypothetical protein